MKEQKDDTYMVGIAVSLFDLCSVKESKDILLSKDKDKLEGLLHSIGFDIEFGYDLTAPVLHRPAATNKVWMGRRFEGIERSDDEWLKSGHASQEAIVQYTKDHTLRSDLIYMSQRPRNTQAAMEYVKDNFNHKGEKKNV